MCIEVGYLPDGTEIPCRKCWQCIETKIDDWVGRCVAENETSLQAHSITLTYGRDEDDEKDHLRAAWLTYSDVQKYFKLLRRHGFKFRYLVAGEYGGKKGRAHWHLLMFWQGKVPPHELSVHTRKRFLNKYWPHGFQHWEKLTPRSARYACKYICKDQTDLEQQGHFSMSKKPPLGDAYFTRLAQKYVDQGLAPQSYKYRFPHIKRDNGMPKEFVMRGTTAHNFIEKYKALWLRHQGGFHPHSDIIEEHDDKIARRDYFPAKEPFRPRIYPPIGCGPVYEAKCPHDDNRMRLYAKDELYRWWYLPDEEGYAWQREKINGGIENSSLPHPSENQYLKAKRGREQAKPPR